MIALSFLLVLLSSIDINRARKRTSTNFIELKMVPIYLKRLEPSTILSLLCASHHAHTQNTDFYLTPSLGIRLNQLASLINIDPLPHLS